MTDQDMFDLFAENLVEQLMMYQVLDMGSHDGTVSRVVSGLHRAGMSPIARGRRSKGKPAMRAQNRGKGRGGGGETRRGRQVVASGENVRCCSTAFRGPRLQRGRQVDVA